MYVCGILGVWVRGRKNGGLFVHCLCCVACESWQNICISCLCICDFCSYFLSAVGFFEEFERIWTQIRRTSVILVDRWWLYKKNMMACWVKKGEKWVSFDFSKIYSSKFLAMWLLSLVLSLKSFKNVISNKNCIPHYFFINILSNPIQR